MRQNRQQTNIFLRPEIRENVYGIIVDALTTEAGPPSDEVMKNIRFQQSAAWGKNVRRVLHKKQILGHIHLTPSKDTQITMTFKPYRPYSPKAKTSCTDPLPNVIEPCQKN